MFQKIEIEIDIPEGYEFVRYGVPEVGELYLGVCYPNVHLREPSSPIVSKYFIVKKIKQWRDPVLPADHGKEARFSDTGKNWEAGRLDGWCNGVWYPSRVGVFFRFCQVCD